MTKEALHYAEVTYVLAYIAIEVKSNNENCLAEWDDLGGGSIMLWAGVSMYRKTQSVPIHENMKAMRYQNYVIRLVLLPHICANRGMMFAQDNTPCHEIHRQCM